MFHICTAVEQFVGARQFCRLLTENMLMKSYPISQFEGTNKDRNQRNLLKLKTPLGKVSLSNFYYCIARSLPCN